MITDYDIAQLVLNLYNTDKGWTYYQPEVGTFLKPPHHVCFAISYVEGATILTFRGSASPWDWIEDFKAVADPFTHYRLGPVHPGFLSGMAEAIAIAEPYIKGPIIVDGHSLGAGRAPIGAGLLHLMGYKVIAVIGFGPPRPGFQELADLIKPIPQRFYRNRSSFFEHDFITDVPARTLIEKYTHTAVLTDVDSPPRDGFLDKWGPFGWHHMELYAPVIPKTPILVTGTMYMKPG